MAKLISAAEGLHRRAPATHRPEPRLDDHQTSRHPSTTESLANAGNQRMQQLARGGQVPTPLLAQLSPRLGNRALQRLVQTKLIVGPPNDQYEQEADRVANQVVESGPANASQAVQRAAEEEEIQTRPLATTISRLVQRADAEEEEPVQTKPLISALQRETSPDDEELQTKADGRAIQRAADDEELQTSRQALQRAPEDEEIRRQAPAPPARATDGFEADSAIESRLASLQGHGSALPENTRATLESRFGSDFSQVRVHADSTAAQLNRQLSAQAFTHGTDIYFGDGRYDPQSADGQRLLAHELTHVVQQTGARPVQPRRDDS